MRGTLRLIDERWFVEYESTQSSRPIKRRMWWAVERIARNEYQPQYGPEDGCTVESNGSGWWSGRGFTVWFPGNKEAERYEDLPIDPPKVRRGIETRYYQGRWQKLLKKGWIDT